MEGKDRGEGDEEEGRARVKKQEVRETRRDKTC